MMMAVVVVVAAAAVAAAAAVVWGHAAFASNYTVVDNLSVQLDDK